MKNSLIVVGLSGKKFTGKSTNAGLLKEKYNKSYTCNIVSFSDSLKKSVSLIFDIPLRFLLDQKLKSSIYKNNITYVEIMQRYADFVRNIDEDYFVNKTSERINNLFGTRPLVANLMDAPFIVFIDDVRLPNECEFVRNNGFIIHLERDHGINLPAHIKSHNSETSIVINQDEYALSLPNNIEDAFKLVDGYFSMMVNKITQEEV